jgi:hypothetical protein
MSVLKAALAAISTVLALQSAYVTIVALSRSNASNAINGGACLMLFSIYPIWFLVRRNRQRGISPALSHKG